jgi:nitrogen fixation protein FixH
MSCCGVFIMPLEATQSRATPDRQVRPITGRFVLIAFVSFFGIIAAVNAVMMTLAIRTMPGLDVKNGYVASQAMNREIEAVRKQTARGWEADVAVTLAMGRAPVSVRFTDGSNGPVTGLDVSARLAHPAVTRADHSVALIETRPGFYAADVLGILPGGWTLEVEAKQRDQRVFMSRNRIVLTEKRP